MADKKTLKAGVIITDSQMSIYMNLNGYILYTSMYVSSKISRE